jgi:hypothetical protein
MQLIHSLFAIRMLTYNRSYMRYIRIYALFWFAPDLYHGLRLFGVLPHNSSTPQLAPIPLRIWSLEEIGNH